MLFASSTGWNACALISIFVPGGFSLLIDCVDRGGEQRHDVAVIGGGAAGLMCAIEAGKRGRLVVVLELADRIGKKIGISGGGRCNFTNVYAAPENFISENPDFCKSALARYTPRDFITLVEKHGIRYHEKKLGQLFCDFSSKQIIQLLLQECEAAGVAIRLGCKVDSVRQEECTFSVASNPGNFSCDSLVIATGGLSIPKIGATDFGYRIAGQFGLKVTERRPALVPLMFTPEDRQKYAKLSGVAVPCVVSHNGKSFCENILFTHRGLSGPAILQISSYWREGDTLEVNVLPDLKADEWLLENHGGKMELVNLLSQKLPLRFCRVWCDCHAPSKPMNRHKAQELRKIGRLLNRWPVRFTASEGYEKAEVTLGGVDTAELSSKTMEARKVTGLYFIGEVVDVTGWLGGFNFQWAWASGHAAGQVV